MMASVCLWHLCADSLVECRTAILKIDGLGRSMTYLWKDWELMRLSTADWWVESQAVGAFVFLNVCAQDRWRDAQVNLYQHLSLQKAHYFFIDPQPPSTTANHRPTSYSPKEREHPVHIWIIYATAVHILLFNVFVFWYCTIYLCKNMLETAADLQLLFTSTAMPTLAIWICIIPNHIVWETEG